MIHLLLFLLLLTVGGCGELAIPTAGDAAEANAIVREMKDRYTFRVMSTRGEDRSVLSRPHRDYTEVYVYGGYTPSEQEEICNIVKTIRSESATKSIHLYFYPHELAETNLMRKEIFD